MTSDFKPLFDHEDPRDDPNRDVTKPVLPVKFDNERERISSDVIRITDEFPNNSLPLRIPCQCNGQAWLRPSIDGKTFEVGHPDFGKVVACSCYAAEIAGKKQDYLWNISGLKYDKDLPSFDNFKKDLSPDAEYAKDTTINWINDESSTWLIIIGSPGLGKTHLAKAAAVNLIALGKAVMFATVREVLNKSRSWISTKQNEKWITYLAQLEKIKYLVLDDLGQEYATDWSRQVLFDIIDTRYESRNPTLITTNISTKDWRNYLGSASDDRLNDYSLTKHIVMSGRSVRKIANR